MISEMEFLPISVKKLETIKEAILSTKTGLCSNPVLDGEGSPLHRCGGCYSCVYDQIIDSSISTLVTVIEEHLLGEEI